MEFSRGPEGEGEMMDEILAESSASYESLIHPTDSGPMTSGAADDLEQPAVADTIFWAFEREWHSAGGAS